MSDEIIFLPRSRLLGVETRTGFTKLIWGQESLSWSDCFIFSGIGAHLRRDWEERLTLEMDRHPAGDGAADVLLCRDGHSKHHDDHHCVSAAQSVQKIVIIFRSCLRYTLYQSNNLLHVNRLQFPFVFPKFQKRVGFVLINSKFLPSRNWKRHFSLRFFSTKMAEEYNSYLTKDPVEIIFHSWVSQIYWPRSHIKVQEAELNKTCSYRKFYLVRLHVFCASQDEVFAQTPTVLL